MTQESHFKFCESLEALQHRFQERLESVKKDTVMADTAKRTEINKLEGWIKNIQSAKDETKFLVLAGDTLLGLLQEVMNDAVMYNGKLSPLSLVKIKRLGKTMKEEFLKINSEE